MGKKYLSIILTLSLLAGVLSCGLVLRGTADIVQPSTEQKDGYVVQAFEDTTYAAYAGQVMAQPNVAAAASRKLYDGVAKFGTTGTAGSVTDTKGAMMDGVIPGVYGAHDEADSNAYKGHYSAAYYLFLDFGGTASVEQIMLAGPALTALERNTKLGTVTVWLGDDPATLTTAPVATYTETVNVAALITPTAPVSARYAAVKITGGADWSRFAELGFYSSAPAKAQKDGYTMATFADPVYKSFAAGIMARPNVLKGVTPAAYGDATLSGSTGTINNSTSYVTDGNIPGLTDDETSGNYKIHWNSATSPYLLYDLAGTASVDQLLLAGCYPDYTGRWEIKFGSVKIYMGNDKDTLIAAENLVIDATFDMAALFTLEEAVECRYIALHFVDSYARVSELGVYTKDDAPVVVPPVINDKGTYVEATIDKPAQVHAFAEALARKNVIDGVVPTVYNAATLTGSTGTINNSPSYATDGNIPGLTDNGTSGNYKIHWNSATSPYLLYDLAGTGSIDQLLLAGCYLDYTGWEFKFGSVKIYMGNDKDTLIAAENLVIDATFDVAALFTFKEVVECRYIALHFVDSYARVSELGVYTKDDAPVVIPPTTNDKGSYTETLISKPDHSMALDDVLVRESLVAGKDPALYGEATLTGTAGSVSVDIGYEVDTLTNGNIPGITDTKADGMEKVFWDVNSKPYLYYYLGGIAEVDSLLLAGSYPEYKQYGTTLGSVKVYMGNNKATLVSDANLKIDTTVSVATLFTFKEAVSCRYIAIMFGGVGGCARVSELGVYGQLVSYPPTFYTAMSSVGEVTMKAAPLSEEDHVFFDETLGGFTISETTLPSTVNRYTDNNWLMVDGNTVFTIQLIDKTGNPIAETGDIDTALNGRELEFSFPATGEYVQSMAVLKDNTLQRLYNAAPNKETRRINAGVLGYAVTPSWTDDEGVVQEAFNNRDKAVLSSTKISLVYLRTRDAESINNANNMPVNDNLLDFMGKGVNGASANTVKAQKNVLWIALVVILTAVGTVAVFVLLRRRRAPLEHGERGSQS